MPQEDVARLQRVLTREFVGRRRIAAPAVFFRPHTGEPDAKDAFADNLEIDLGSWDGPERNLGVRLEGGHLELGIKAGDDAFAHAFFLAAEHLRLDARAAYGVDRISSVIIKVEDQELIEPWAQRWPGGFKDRHGHWTETTVKTSSAKTKNAAAIYRYSKPLPGSIVPEGVVVWRPKGKAAALDVDFGVEDLEPRALASTGMDVLIRALAYATLAYWIRVYLDGLTEWDSILTGRVGGWIARCEVDGRRINASGKSLESICWGPIDTREQALDLIKFLGKIGADANLKIAYLQSESQLQRDPLTKKVPGWPAITNTFGVHGRQGIRRAFEAGLDLEVVERMSEKYILDISTHEYIDRERMLQGLTYNVTHERLIRDHLNNKIAISPTKKANAFLIYASCDMRTDVDWSDMYPGEEPGAILRCHNVYGLLKDKDLMEDEYRVFNIYPGFAIKPAGTINQQTMRDVVTSVDRMLGYLTQDNDAQIDWLKKFIAWTVQHPDKKQQVAPVIIGGQGVGKTVFGNAFMQAIFGEMAGLANAANLESNFYIAPYVGKLMVYIDEAKIGSTQAINEIKKLIRETKISGEFKFKDVKIYRIYARLIMTANQADIGLNPEDAADRALFFVASWNHTNKKMNKVEFNNWTNSIIKPFYAGFVDMLEKVDVREHLMHYFMNYKCTRAELEDLTHSSRDDASVVKATESKARKIARRIAANGCIVPGLDLTAWFTTHHLRGAIFREDGQRSRVEMEDVMSEFEEANVIEPTRQGGDSYRFKYGYGKTLLEMGKAHNMPLLPGHDTGPGDFSDNPVMSNVNPPPWRGLNKRGGDGRRRSFNPRDDYVDDEE